MTWPAALVVALLLAGALTSCGQDARQDRAASPAQSAQRVSAEKPAHLTFRRASRLPSPVQLPATVGTTGGRVLAIGGLSVVDTSTDAIAVFVPSMSPRTVGRLSAPVHDAAAANIAGRAYLFGGGNTGSSSQIVRVTSDGRTSSAGQLPVGASDVSAASVGSTAYIVGGYTETTPLRTILAFTPGMPVEKVATLPKPLRYAAVAAVGQSVLIAGGTSGTAAQRAVLRFDPRSGRVERIGELARPLTHAAGASLGGRFYVIGGRGDLLDSASAAVEEVDPATGRVRVAGRLPTALSDAGAASDSDRIVVVGGRDSSGRVRDEILTTGKGQ